MTGIISTVKFNFLSRVIICAGGILLLLFFLLGTLHLAHRVDFSRYLF